MVVGLTKVLVVDDSRVVYKMIRKALEPKGYNVVGHAENGMIGLELYQKLKPDVVTLDITMPVMGGLEMARELFKLDPDARIVMLSAMGDEDLYEVARNIGIGFFTTKPVDPEKLEDMIKICLSGS